MSPTKKLLHYQKIKYLETCLCLFDFDFEGKISDSLLLRLTSQYSVIRVILIVRAFVVIIISVIVIAPAVIYILLLNLKANV